MNYENKISLVQYTEVRTNYSSVYEWSVQYIKTKHHRVFTYGDKWSGITNIENVRPVNNITNNIQRLKAKGTSVVKTS